MMTRFRGEVLAIPRQTDIDSHVIYKPLYEKATIRLWKNVQIYFNVDSIVLMTIVAENWAVFFHVNSIFSTIKMSSYRVLLTLFPFDVLLVFLKFVY